MIYNVVGKSNVMTRRTYIKILIGIVVSIFFLFWYHRKTGFYRIPDLGELLQKKNLIIELTETIIPATDTPGAKAANVADFVVDYVRDCAGVTEQRNFIRGLNDVEQHSKRQYGQTFAACSVDERIAILKHIENRSRSSIQIVNKINNKLFGKPFIVLLKELTVEGYCTSEIGANQGLAYDYIPVHFEPCTVLQPGQKSWATK